MLKKYILFFVLIYILTGCGTDYMLSSFYLRQDFAWPTSPSQQKTLDYYKNIAGDLLEFNLYTSPSILATPENYLLVFYEIRDKPADPKVYGVDGIKDMGVYVAISKNAETFSASPIRVGNTSDTYGSPVSFVKGNRVVVLATGGIGFGDGQADEVTKISVSISTNNGYNWTAWTNVIDTDIFKPLLKDYNRFYTNPGNGVVLANGALVCMIDYKVKGTDTTPAGAAIIYSTDNGITWQLGSTITYSGHRWARVIAERTDGKLLIAAVPNTTGDVTAVYNNNGALAWYMASSLEGNISSFQPSGLPNNSGGSISGDRIQYTENGISKSGILLLHSSPDRDYTNPGDTSPTGQVKNAMSMSISEDEGQTWTLITNAIGTSPFRKTSFRQSMKVLKDGSIATCIEEGEREEIQNAAGKTFYIVYKRMGLYVLSGGKYSYEGI
ncbi:sialidase family protein [Brachyspira pilosicoli]|uniref:sialidase family protein n=1 Tax=Brachyspira pilosicoli TaxID=52584 RepID=UPI0030061361